MLLAAHVATLWWPRRAVLAANKPLTLAIWIGLIVVGAVSLQAPRLLAAGWLVAHGVQGASRHVVSALIDGLYWLAWAFVVASTALHLRWKLERRADALRGGLIATLWASLGGSFAVALSYVGLASAAMATSTMLGIGAGAAAWISLANTGVARPAQPSGRRSIVAAFVWVAIACAPFVLASVRWWRTPNATRPASLGRVAPVVNVARVDAHGAVRDPELLWRPGQATVIEFWATWCGPCRVSLPALAQLAVELPHVRVMAVNVDDAQKGRALFDELALSLPLYVDVEAAAERFMATRIPHIVVLDPQGLVKAQGQLDVQAVRAQLRTLEP